MNKDRFMKTLILALALLLVGACSKEEFVGSPRSESFVANPIEVFQNLTCANSSTVKPPVDILYVVDNSMSSTYIGPIVKEQIRQTVQNISQEFDYRVVVAPLFANGSDSYLPVITNNASGITHLNIVNLEYSNFFTAPSGSNAEKGFERARTLISNNRSNGMFRNGAHTLIVMASNGDDTDSLYCFNGQCFPDTNQNMQQQVDAFNTLKSSLSAQQLRFFSLVPFSGCQSGWVRGDRYIEMSKRLSATQANGADAYNLCSSNYNLYTGVNQTIRQQIVPHVYNRWLVTANNTPVVLESVHRLNSSGQATLLSPSLYSFSDTYVSNQNTRIQPTVGEPQSGKFITLQPSAYLTYPDCLVVKTTTPTEYYGYAVVPTAPRPETLVVRVRGSNVNQSTTNGWEYLGYRENQNIKVNANGTANNTNPLNRTGYFIKLNGSAIYSSGETIEVFYTPAPI